MTAAKSPGVLAAHGASEIDGLGRHVVSQINRQRQLPQVPIRATLVGSDRCDAEGISARGHAPVLDLCRELIEAGHDPERALHAYRNGVLALAVFRSLGEAAELTVADDRHGTPRLRRRQERSQRYVAGSPVAQNANGREVATPAETATTTTTITAMHTTTTGMATAASMPTTATSGMAATAAVRGGGGVGQPATQEAAP
jgi:hypothetical protein